MQFSVKVQTDVNLRLVALVAEPDGPRNGTSVLEVEGDRGLDELYDLTDAGGFLLDRNDVVTLREAWEGSTAAIPGRLAIVAPSDLAFGLARMYVSMAEGSRVHRDRRVFRTMAEARQWLGLPDEWSPEH